MHNRSCFIFLMALLPLCAQAQRDTLVRVMDSLAAPLPPVSATTDLLGNLLALYPNGSADKKVTGNAQTCHFSTTRLGQATRIDATNPLKTLLWFADFNTIVWLDRNFTTVGGELNLARAGFYNVRTVAAAVDGNVWLYDEAGFKLRKITPDGQPMLESQDLNLLLEKGLHPCAIHDDGTRVMLIDSTQGIFLFDVYAQWIKQIPMNGLTDAVFIDNGSIRFIDPADGKIYRVNPDFPVPVPPATLPAAIRPGDPLWLSPDGVVVWQKGMLNRYRW